MGDIGSKQKRITIQKPTLTTDSQGGKTRTWSTRCTVWAHERPLSGREAIQASAVTASLTSVWEIWYRSDISVKDRIVFGSRTVEIAAVVDPTDTRAELHLYGSEVQA